MLESFLSFHRFVFNSELDFSERTKVVPCVQFITKQNLRSADTSVVSQT